MARDAFIISTNEQRIRITEKDGTQILFDEIDSLGNWSVKVTGNTDLTNAASNITFYSKTRQANTGAAGFDEVTSVLINGVESLSNYGNWQELIDDIASSLFIQNAQVSGSLTGMATAANQSTLLVRFGENVTTPNSLSLLGRIKALQDASTPIDVAITPLTTQGASITQAITGRKMGGFQWTFTKNAGTNGLGTLYGTIDGTNYINLGDTGSQTADATGVIRFDENWKTLKFEFTTQTGAGSTFSGTFYAS